MSATIQNGQTSHTSIYNAMCSRYSPGFTPDRPTPRLSFLLTGEMSKTAHSEGKSTVGFHKVIFQSWGRISRTVRNTTRTVRGLWAAAKVPLAFPDRWQERLMDWHGDIHADFRKPPPQAECIHSQRRSDALAAGAQS
jgi:hypothetical protein